MKAALIELGDWEKAPLLQGIRRWPWTDDSQEFPAFIAHSLRCRTTLTSGRKCPRTWPSNPRKGMKCSIGLRYRKVKNFLTES